LSSPSASRVASRSACVESGLVITSTGSPSAETPANTITDIANSTMKLWMTRRMMNASMADSA
jgi:hypothetical protein